MFFLQSSNASVKGLQGLCMCNSKSHIKNVTDKNCIMISFFCNKFRLSYFLRFTIFFDLEFFVYLKKKNAFNITLRPWLPLENFLYPTLLENKIKFFAL